MIDPPAIPETASLTTASRERLAAATLALASIAALAIPARADETLAGIACRSVHLGYPAPRGRAFYNEVTVEESARGTYFMACGFDAGYFGIQELGDGKKVVLFSVWDPGQGDDPKAVEEGRRVVVRHRDDQVRVGRFGGEGTGGQSFFDYDWKVGQAYRFLVKATPEDATHTAFAAFFFVPESGRWKHLVSFSTITKAAGLGGYYSFIEDFRRDRVSATEVRSARFGGGWVEAADGHWIALTRAKFTADGNPATTIDAAVAGDAFRLATGGATRNAGTPLGGTLDRPPTGLQLP